MIDKDPIQQLYDSMHEDALNEVRSHKKPSQHFRASEADNCMRRIWYRLSGKRPAPRSVESNLRGIDGDNAHDLLRLLLISHGVNIDGIRVNEETGAIEEILNLSETIDGITITGRPDGVIETPHGMALLEVKSTGYWPYYHLNKVFAKDGHDAALERVKEKHKGWYWQCQVMMHISRYELVYLVVKDKSSSIIGQYETDDAGKSMPDGHTGIYIEYDPKAIEEILQRFQYVNRKLQENEPPNPEFSEGSNDCSWCQFRYACHDAALRKEQGLEPYEVYPGPQIDGAGVE